MPPQINLQPGSTNTQAVKQLQDYLVSQGLMTQAQVNTGYGIYGPQTKAAVAALQKRLGVDAGADAGYFGPKTIAAISANVNPVIANQQAAARLGVSIPGVGGGNSLSSTPQTQAHVDAQYASAVASHPVLAGNTPEMLNYAMTTGDLSSLVNATGRPFSAADQNAALSEATAALDPYYRAMETKDTQDIEATLASKKADYEAWLQTQGQNFQTEKAQQDQNAANQGVLFSGGRAQKLRQLQSNYEAANANKKASVGVDIGNIARDFGYKYGDTAANKLSSYFNIGGNTYNPNVATGGVGSSGLSSIYNANQGFQGTIKNTQKAEAQKRAAGLLYNKGNKLLSTGYTNQY